MPTANELIVSAYQWQTLIAGILAVVVALATIARIGDQIERDNTQARNERAKAVLSRKALLPHSLSDICDLIERDCKALDLATNEGDKSGHYRLPPFAWPGSMAATLENIRQVVEYEDNDTVSQQRLILLLSRLQIYRARRRPDGRDTIISRHTLESRTIDAIETYSVAASLFQYARPTSHREKSDRDEVFSAAHNLGYWEPTDGVYNLLKKHYPDEPAGVDTSNVAD